MINDFLEIYAPLSEYLTVYETPEGKRVYEETLAATKEQYPQYIREIEGTADGAKVPFFKVRCLSFIFLKGLRGRVSIALPYSNLFD